MANVVAISIRGINDTSKAFGSAQKGMASLQKSALGLAKSIAAVAGVASITLFTKSIIDSNDELAKMSQQLGVSTEFLSSMKLGSELAGSSIDELTTGLRLFAKSIDTATKGGKSLEYFETLGVSMRDSAGNIKTNEALFREVSDAVAGLEDGALKTSVAMGLFGESGARLIPLLNGGAQGLDKIRAMAERYGVVLSGPLARNSEEFNDRLTILKAQFTGIVQQILQTLLPVLNDLGQKFSQFVEWVSGSSTSAEIFRAAIVGLTIVLLAYRSALITTGISQAAFAALFGPVAIKSIADFRAAVSRLPAAIKPVTISLGKLVAAVAAVATAFEIANEARKMFGAQAGENESASNLSASLRQQANVARQAVAELTDLGLITQQKADEIRSNINKALIMPDVGQASSALRAVGVELMRFAEDRRRAAAEARGEEYFPIGDPGVAAAKVALAQAKLGQWNNNLKRLYQLGALTQEQYIQRRLNRVEEFHAIEIAEAKNSFAKQLEAAADNNRAVSDIERERALKLQTMEIEHQVVMQSIRDEAFNREMELGQMRLELEQVLREQRMIAELDSQQFQQLTMMEAEITYLQMVDELRRNSIENFRASFVNFISSVIPQFSSAMGNAIADIIMGVTTAREAFKQLGQQMVRMVIEYFAQLIVNQLLYLILGKAIQAAATAASVAMSATLAASWAVPASLAMIATMGSAGAATGLIPPLLIANAATAKGLALGGAFQSGIDLVPNDMVAAIHAGERVVPAQTNEDLTTFLTEQATTPIEVTVMLDGDAIYSAIHKASRNGRLMIDARAVA